MFIVDCHRWLELDDRFRNASLCKATDIDAVECFACGC